MKNIQIVLSRQQRGMAFLTSTVDPGCKATFRFCTGPDHLVTLPVPDFPDGPVRVRLEWVRNNHMFFFDTIVEQVDTEEHARAN